MSTKKVKFLNHRHDGNAETWKDRETKIKFNETQTSEKYRIQKCR